MKIVIEVDGGVHDLPAVGARDEAKAAAAAALGYRLIRLRNDDALSDDTARLIASLVPSQSPT